MAATGKCEVLITTNDKQKLGTKKPLYLYRGYLIIFLTQAVKVKRRKSHGIVLLLVNIQRNLDSVLSK
ncbi:hypothetical protein GCM10008107_16320 [Psychrosphaera saromensis]|nr:hypothetical protein GCM10008107_16320 [Psychrosphaera saromensis]GLQ15088.1 hypothetical protein GCM10007917_25430 [Psychrosphaera saromensis]